MNCARTRFLALLLAAAMLLSLLAGCSAAVPVRQKGPFSSGLCRTSAPGEFPRKEIMPPEPAQQPPEENSSASAPEEELIGTVNDIPLLTQSYTITPFSKGTVATAGCGITCLAMLSSWYYDCDYTPEQMGRWFNISKTNPAACMDWGIWKMGIPLEGQYYGPEALEKVWIALDEGRPCILLMGKESYFTDTGHFILATGRTEDGLYMINDPYAFNWDLPWLAEGYAIGFTREFLTFGLQGCYIFGLKKDFEFDPENLPDYSKDKKPAQETTETTAATEPA